MAQPPAIAKTPAPKAPPARTGDLPKAPPETKASLSLVTNDAMQAPPPKIPTALPIAPSAFDDRPDEQFSYWRDLRKLAGRMPATATEMIPLRDGATALKARTDLIRSAKTSVLVSIYHINPDESGHAFMDALIERANAGIPVVLKMDGMPQSVASGMFDGDAKKQLEAKFEALQAAGGTIVYNVIDHRSERAFGSGDHFKALIVDGGTAIFGGRNVGDYYFKTWTDFDMQLKGTLASQIAYEAIENVMKAAPLGIGTSDEHAEFLRKMDLITKDMARARDANGLEMNQARRRGDTGHEGQLITWDPQYDKGDNAITLALIKSIDTSTKEILLTSNYVNGTTEVREALINAAKRGVKVTVMTSSLAVSALSTMPYLNAERFYDDLMKAGITIRETTRFEHGKLYLFDDKVAAFGSYNVEHPADNMLAEGMIFTQDADMVKIVRDSLNDTLENRTKPYVKVERGFWESIAVFFTRILAWFLEPFI